MKPTTTQELLNMDRRFIWHPFTQMKDYANRDHILMERAQGVKLYDAAGNAYYDSISSWWVNPHGHGRPEIIRAITEQLQSMDHIQFSGFTHRPAIELAEQLVRLMPEGLNKVFYSDNGSTAVEVALKMSFQYWQQSKRPSKTKFAFLKNSYHGDTLGAVSVGGVDLFHALYKPLLFHAHPLPAPATYSNLEPPASVQAAVREDVDRCLAAAEQLFAQKGEEIAALIVEPMVQAAGGMNMYEATFLSGLRTLCERYDIHLIADEVAVGFGRTGELFACEHARITPDIICLSKALTGGVLPLSVTICSDHIYDAFYDDYDSNKTFFHGHGYTANPIACAAALASLDLFEQTHTVEHIRDRSQALRRCLGDLKRHPLVTNLRQLGMIAAFDLAEPPHPVERLGFHVYLEGLKHGLVLRPLGNVLYYWLPFCVTDEDLAEITSRTIKVLDHIANTVY